MDWEEEGGGLQFKSDTRKEQSAACIIRISIYKLYRFCTISHASINLPRHPEININLHS